MRQIHWAAAFLALALLPEAAGAEDVYNLNQNQSGFTLPGVTLPQGQDEVRAADGTTCRNSVSGSGAYVDVGVIRGNGTDSRDLATYGRLVIPLGRQPKRLDCARLYELEVQRLQMELRLAKMGLGAGGTASQTDPTGDWAIRGWTDAKSR
jgi:hypothetical protein